MSRKFSACCSRTLTLAIFLTAFAAAPVGAQTQSARLVGTVHDASGAVVPNAKVSAVNSATKVKTETTTNASGDYVLPALQPGTYALNVEAAGFRKEDIEGIELAAAANESQSVTLEVGQTNEVVEVNANTVTVQTSDAQVATSVTIKDIETLPQLARTPITLSIFQPGLQINPQANGSSSGADYSYAHINGLRQGSNNNTLDGIDVNDSVVPRLGLSLTANNTDSVEEVRIVTSGGKAEYGRSAGGQVQLVTRSGSNQFHGNAFDYLRNRDLNANDFFDNSNGVPIPVLIQNTFGGSFGGPIKHNKLFAFGNYQGIRTHAQGVQNTEVPTATAEQGIFEWNSGGSVQQYNIINNDPLHRGIDPTVASLLKLYPAPNNNNCSGADGLNSSCYIFNFPNGSYSDQLTIKVDYNISEKMHIFERTSWQRNSSVDSLNNAQNIVPNEPGGTQGGKRWGVAGGWDWTISPSMVNEFRYGHQSASVEFVRPERVAGPMYTFNTWTFTNGSPLLTAFPQGRNSPVNEYTDNLTLIHGRHTIKVGGQLRFTKQYGYNDAGIYPNVSLSTANGNILNSSLIPSGLTSTQLTTFQGMYNDILGRISSVTETYYSNLTTFQAAGTPRVRNFLFHEYGFFGQDDWKVNRKLTLNFGLRWEFFPVPSEQNGQQGILTPANVFNTAGESSSITVQPSGKWWSNNYTNFAPRFGLAWDPFGDGKTSLRAGYGIFNDRIVGAATSSVDGATPGFSQGVTLFPNSTSGSDIRVGSAPPLPTQPASPALTPAATRQVSVDLMNPNLKTGYVHQWNFNVQRQIAKNTILDVGYVGNRGIKLFFQTNLDQSYIYNNGFLTAFNQIAGNLTNLNAVPLTNPIVSIFGSASAAVSAIGSSVFSTGQVGTAANTVDVNNYTKYAAAGISQYYLRRFPQFSTVLMGTNDGRSQYDSLQMRLQRQIGALRVAANYTWSKSIDNDLSTATGGEGNGFAAPLDSFNVALDRGRSNFDIPHAFTMTSQYTLPIGKGQRFGGNMPRWANTLIGGWDVGALMILESGSPFTVSSGRATGPSTANTWADYTGSRNIGSVATSNNGIGPGVYYFTAAQIASFSEPTAGDIGSSGRNTFRGPRFFNLDTSLVKRFELMEKKYLTFRAEAYNLLNNVDFANPGVNLGGNAIAFGRISGVVNNPRIVQLALRLDF